MNQIEEILKEEALIVQMIFRIGKFLVRGCTPNSKMLNHLELFLNLQDLIILTKNHSRIYL